MSKARSTRVSWCFVGPRRALAGWRCGGLWASRVAEWWHRFLLRRAAGLLLALWVAACARPPAGASGGVVSEAVERQGHPVFMWRTQSATSVVHLLGSIHVGNADLYPLDPRIDRAFEASDALVLEIDLDENAEAEAALAFVQLALLPKGETLDEHLDEELRRLLDDRLMELGIPYENLAMFRPWFVAMTIEMKDLELAGFSGEYGIDQHFRERAVGKKAILELESVEEQAALFASLTRDAELDDLRLALESTEDASEMLAAMTAQWRVGNTELIEAEVEATRTEHPEAYESLYASRNRRMTEKVEGFLATNDDYFVVAGGAHMVGEEGIVRLLEKKGHVVEQQ